MFNEISHNNSVYNKRRMRQKTDFATARQTERFFTVPRALSGWGTLKWLGVWEWLRVLNIGATGIFETSLFL